jgi:DNA-binding MarR family transcriptional regulator
MPLSDAELLEFAGDLRAILGRFSRRLREEGGVEDFTSSQKSALAALERDAPVTLASLARTVGMRPQSMSQTIASLTEAGLVAGVPDPHDGRKTLLSLSGAAKAQLLAARQAKKDWLYRSIRDRLDEAGQRDLVRGVDALRKLLDA